MGSWAGQIARRIVTESYLLNILLKVYAAKHAMYRTVRCAIRASQLVTHASA